MPKRIQLRRTKGWRKPEGAVVVARPTKWGNPFRVGRRSWTMQHGRKVGEQWVVYDDNGVDYPVLGATREGAIARCVELFEWDLTAPIASRVTVEDVRRELAGRDLACWCPPDQPCHADVLLEIANGA